MTVIQGVTETMEKIGSQRELSFHLVQLLRSQNLNLTCNVFTLVLVAKDVNILFDELEAVNSPCKDDDSLLHPGNLTSASEDASRLEAGGEVGVCGFLKNTNLFLFFLPDII